MPLKKTPIILYKLPAIVFAIAILYLAVTSMPEPPLDVPMSDKIAHFGAFLLLGVLSAVPFRRGGKTFFWAFALPVVYGVIIEIIQSRVPGRNAEFTDFVADALGVFVSYIVIVIYLRYKHHKTTE